MKVDRRPRVGYLSPLPPVRSGVSEYSVDLIPALLSAWDLRLFAAPPATGSVAGIKVEAPELFDASEVDLAVYHMGNNVHHRFVYERALQRPGLLVMHDLVLHHFHIEQTLARDRPHEYMQLMEETYGEAGWSAGLARVHNATSDLPYFVFPLFEQLVARSRGVIVHNRRAARHIRDRVAGVPVSVVPMGIPAVDADPLPDRAAARRELGIPSDELVIGSFGFATPIKRPNHAIAGFAAAGERLGPSRFVVIGEVSASLDLAESAARYGVSDRVMLLGYLDYEVVKLWVAATDVFVNLRYPTAGETSASLLRLLGWGKPVVVSDYAQFRELPASVAPRVSVEDELEIAELTEVLVVLGARPEVRAAFARAAADFVRQEHALERAASGYIEVANELLAAPAIAGGEVRRRGFSATSRTPAYPSVEIVAEPLPRRMPPGSRVRLAVQIRNRGATKLLRGPFESGGDCYFGGYLRGRTVRPLASLRWASLPRDLAPGDSTEVMWVFTLPELEGDFELIADVNIVGYGWLHARGSQALMFPIRLSSRA